jgi:hypothetical protein
MRRRESSVRAPAFGMHPALGNHFAIKMRELLDQPDVLEQRRATTPGRHNICVVRYRRPGCIGKAF